MKNSPTQRQIYQYINLPIYCTEENIELNVNYLCYFFKPLVVKKTVLQGKASPGPLESEYYAIKP